MYHAFYFYMFKIWMYSKLAAMVYWLAQWPLNQLIAGSNPGVGRHFYFFFLLKMRQKVSLCMNEFF